jgi:hypothetical protein
MEISAEIKNNIRYYTVRGAIDIDELTGYLKQIYSSSGSKSEMDVFWDLREADFTSIATEEVFGFIEFVGVHWGKEGKSKAALVVSHDLGYGLSRMYEMLMGSKSSSTIAIFRDMEEAEEWIKQNKS